MAKIFKTKPVRALQGNWGCGWEDICVYDTKDAKQMRELKDDIRAYRENDKTAIYRVISRRVANPLYIKRIVEQ